MAKKNTDTLQNISLIGKIIFLMTGILAASISFYALIFIVIGMLPTLVAKMIDRSSGKYASKIVGAFNYMGLLPFMFKVWGARSASHLVVDMVWDPATWFFTYSAAGLGWIVVIIAPKIALAAFATKTEMRINVLRDKQAALIEEWGEDVTKPDVLAVSAGNEESVEKKA